MSQQFLPISKQDMQERSWDKVDFLFISGDAYVDHPSFAVAIISRILEKQGYRVGIIAQPDWRNTVDFKRLGKPRLGILICAGNLDSMLNKYTAAKKIRSSDSYSPGGKPGLRPERATIVYANRAREAYKNVPIIIGGIEASLRRFTHYDYWSDRIRRSILSDTKADLLIYGMGEKQICEIAQRLSEGIPVTEITDVPGTCYMTTEMTYNDSQIFIPTYDEIIEDKKNFAKACKIQQEEQDPIRGKILVQKQQNEYVVQNPPLMPLSMEEMDAIYDLPYQRTYHPIYADQGGIPAIKEVQFSLISHRGCYGGCSFCAIGSHQGRIIQARSHESIVKEAKLLTLSPDFKGYIHDVGGPTANFRQPSCNQQLTQGTCKDRQCLYPQPCPNLRVDHNDYLQLLRSVRALPKVKKVFIRSGIRFDYLMADKNKTFFRELCQHHISGQLKVAPEHVSPKVLRLMNKSGKAVYVSFVNSFKEINKEFQKEQYLVPYFISSHPGADLHAAIELAEFLRDMHYTPEQVQDFIPTPGSQSTCMYYTELNPLTGENIYVAKTALEKNMQRALLQYRNPQNYDLVYKALMMAGRNDLIGTSPKCLIRPRYNDRPRSIKQQSTSPSLRHTKNNKHKTKK